MAVCGRAYILVSELTAWLARKKMLLSPDGKKLEVCNLNLLLRECYPNALLRIDAEDLQKSNRILLFCILLEIGMGSRTCRFLPHVKSDNQLPMEKLELVRIFTELGRERYLYEHEDPGTIAETFYLAQRKFSAPIFRLHMNKVFLKDHVLPIDKKQRSNEKDGVAEWWEVAVLEEFVEQELRDVARTSRYKDVTDDRWVCIAPITKCFGA